MTNLTTRTKIESGSGFGDELQSGYHIFLFFSVITNIFKKMTTFPLDYIMVNVCVKFQSWTFCYSVDFLPQTKPFVYLCNLANWYNYNIFRVSAIPFPVAFHYQCVTKRYISLVLRNRIQPNLRIKLDGEPLTIADKTVLLSKRLKS